MPSPLRLSIRLPDRPTRRRWIAAGVIALLSALVVMGAASVPQLKNALTLLDTVFYNSFFQLRKDTDKLNGEVVIIGIDDASLQYVEKVFDFGWPWPREYYVPMIRYAERHGAKVVTFDLLFSSKSRTSAEAPDDETFADGVDAAKIPIVFATVADEKGQPSRFAPPVKSRLRFGAANVIDTPAGVTGRTQALRDYEAYKHGMPSLAVKTLQVVGMSLPPFAQNDFQLRYYGPHRRKDGQQTFRYVSAAGLLEAALAEERNEDPAKFGIDPKWFAGKIVLVGSVATALYDAKVTPLSDNFPGVEVHATAIENLIFRQRVRDAATSARWAMTFLSACLAALGAVIYRHVWAKVASLALTVAALLGMSLLFFIRDDVVFVPPAAPLIAAILAGLAALAWSYLTEDRGRKSMEKALAQYVSPEVAREIARDPENLGVGAQRRDMTVMFSDIAGFTGMSENMDAEQLTRVLNFYLEELTEPVLGMEGFVDKFIGDAIMSFWNGPLLEQADHAKRACRAALQMRERERRIQGELRRRGAGDIQTRFGINTGPMAVGNIGSIRKKGYTVIGDSVNLASRLEAANKLYGTQIILTESTLHEVDGAFIVRPLDLLTVKGKTKPMAIYELMAEVPADPKVKRLAERFSLAFEAYQHQRWDEAEAILKEIELYNAEDGPTKTLLNRIAHFRQEPPGVNWDGSYEAKSK